MPREPAAVRVYTVCDESKYLIVRNVPSLGCGDDLANLFATYGPVDESVSSSSHLYHTTTCLCTPMDAEDCDPYTDVFFIKFSQASNARFAKRKLDESVFLGNRLQVSYAPQFESLLDTKEKLEVRRKEVLGRMKCQGSSAANSHHQMSSNKREYTKTLHASQFEDPHFTHVSSNKDYFPSESMNATVNLVREKLDKIQSSSDNSSAIVAPKKPRTDNRRRI
uniref:RNA-binding protein 48 n=1 Tax=Oryza meridionalis TaxID=40149 RepID=A0A0E0CHM4_9ORYZ